MFVPNKVNSASFVSLAEDAPPTGITFIAERYYGPC
jgi:hypothetical protein